MITAAKEYGCRALGFELDPQLVELSKKNAEQAGVLDRVTFGQADIMYLDISHADVVAVYLAPRQLELLLPQLRKLKPGARIVSHQFKIPGIEPDRTLRVECESDGATHQIHLWTAPLKDPS